MNAFRSKILVGLLVLAMVISACGASTTATPGAEPSATSAAGGALAQPTATTAAAMAQPTATSAAGGAIAQPTATSAAAMAQPTATSAAGGALAQPTATTAASVPAPAPPPAATETQPAATPQTPPAYSQYDLKVLPVEDNANIVFSGWGDQTEQQVYRDSITRFNKVYPGVSVDYQPIPSDFQTKAQMAGGTAPDVMYIDNQLITAFGATGQLLALDDYMQQAGVNRSDFIQTLLNEFTIDGKTYALPKDWGSLGLMYLPEAFQQAGVPEPTSKWTWQDLQKAADAINKAGKVKAFCMAPDWARFAPFVYQAGGSFLSSDYKTATLNTPEVLAAANFVAGLKTSGDLVTPSDVGASWCGEALGKQLVAMTYEGGWMVNFMNQTYANVKYNDVQLPSGSKGMADIIFTNGIGVNAATKYPKAAAAFAIFLTSRFNQGQIQMTGFAYSTHPDQLSQLTNPIDQAISTGSSWPATGIEWFGPNTGKFETAISNALSRVFLGQQSVADSFKQAQDEGQAALSGQ